VTTLHCVDDGCPVETTSLLQQACAARDVKYVAVEATSFLFEPEMRAQPGDLLYRPAISMAATRVEQFLYDTGVSTLYREPDDIWFGAMASPMLHQRMGVPVPRTFFCNTTDRSILRYFVEQLGGFPVVVKIQGFSGGLGVIRSDSWPSLFSLVEYLVHQGSGPLLCAYVPDATHWRVVVVGDRAVAAYRNTQETDDFRTYAGTDLCDYPEEVPQTLGELAVRATVTLRRELAGVDILEHGTGRFYVLEANFPCYFAQAQLVRGTDIAGAIVEHLLQKAARLGAR
jgi:hypothetical protein